MPPSLPPEEAAPPPRRAALRSVTALQPLGVPVFRLLWSTWLVANLCMWMSDVAAAWTMTTLTTTPIWVALVQSASTLPVFLLGLPSGALADILDRRRWLMFTQFWLAATALALCAVTASGFMTAPLLLGLVFLNGIGLALRWPVFSAIVPDLVPRAQLASALALNGVAMNLSRIVGPLVAGALIASAGSVWVFALNALLCVISGLVVLRWRHTHQQHPLGQERLISAIRVGVQFVRQSPRLLAVLLRVTIFFFHSLALIGLLPLLAKGMHGGDAGTFTLLLASMGAGAIIAVLVLPRMRQRFGRDAIVLGGTAVQSAATAVMAVASSTWIAVPAMLAAGMAWITVANSLSVSAQMSLPNWVRARGMATYQMAIMGSSALGAALWGQVATVGTMQTALFSAAAFGTLLMLLAVRFVRDSGDEEPDMSPAAARLGQAAFARARARRQPRHHDRVPDRSGAHRGLRRDDAADPAGPPERRRDRLGAAARHRRAGPLRRADHRRVLERAPAPLRPRHRRRRRPARAPARLPRGRRSRRWSPAICWGARSLGARRQPALPAAPPAPAPARARRRYGSRRG